MLTCCPSGEIPKGRGEEGRGAQGGHQLQDDDLMREKRAPHSKPQVDSFEDGEAENGRVWILGELRRRGKSPQAMRRRWVRDVFGPAGLCGLEGKRLIAQ